MTDDGQIEIPQSFIALFVDPGMTKPSASRDHIAQRYDLCEDLATLLVEVASSQHATSRSSTEAEVLQGLHHALLQGETVVSAEEAEWVVHRLAELLNWEHLPSGPG